MKILKHLNIHRDYLYNKLSVIHILTPAGIIDIIPGGGMYLRFPCDRTPFYCNLIDQLHLKSYELFLINLLYNKTTLFWDIFVKWFTCNYTSLIYIQQWLKIHDLEYVEL